MILKCKMCGGDLNIELGAAICECEFCGTMQTIPAVDNEKKGNLFNRANRLRMASEFDKAAAVYESIVAEFPEEAEAYWGLCLCAYGIEYVDDPASGKKVPTCHRSSYQSVMEDPDFEQVLENADVLSRKVYREEAKQIEEIRKGILEVSSSEEPYDIFICYKETDENGERTLDSVLAQDIYDALTAKNYRVFFSRITLEDKLGQEYEPYIFAALNTAKVMLAIGTDYEYYNAVWVKNEWSRFLKLMEQDRSKHLIPCFKGVDAYDMPKEFNKLQAQDLGKVGAVQDLLRGIDKLIAAKPAVIQNAGVQTEDVNRMYIYNSAVEALKDKKPKVIKDAIQKLRSLGDWGDAPEQLKKAEERLHTLKKKKRTKRLIIWGSIALIIVVGIYMIQKSIYDKAVTAEENYRYSSAIKYYERVPNFKDAEDKIAEMNDAIEEQDAAILELLNGDNADEHYGAIFDINGAGAEYVIDRQSGSTCSSYIGSYSDAADAKKLNAFFNSEYNSNLAEVGYDASSREYVFIEPNGLGTGALFRGKLNEDGSLYVYNDDGESYTLVPDSYMRNGITREADVMTADESTMAAEAEKEALFAEIDEYLCAEFINAETGENLFAIEPEDYTNVYLFMPEVGLEGSSIWEIGKMQVKIDLAPWGYEGNLIIDIVDDGLILVSADDSELSAKIEGLYKRSS